MPPPSASPSESDDGTDVYSHHSYSVTVRAHDEREWSCSVQPALRTYVSKGEYLRGQCLDAGGDEELNACSVEDYEEEVPRSGPMSTVLPSER